LAPAEPSPSAENVTQSRTEGAAGAPLEGGIIAAFENKIGHTTFIYDANDDIYFHTAPESQGIRRADATSPGRSLTAL